MPDAGAAPPIAIREIGHVRLRVAGMARAGRFFGAEGEGPSVYLQDPEGNTIELKGPPAP